MRWLCAKRAWFLSCRSFSPSRIESAQSLSGVGDGEVGRAPLPDHLWQGPPVTRNAEIDPGDNDPPPKMTQGVMTPLTPLHHLQQHPRAGSQGVGIATLIFRYFLRYFSSTHRTDLSRFRGTFHRFFGMCVLMKTPSAIKTKRSNFSKIRKSNNRQICKRGNLKVQSRDTISQICQLRACRVESRKLSNIWTMKSRCDQAAQCSPPPLPSSSIKRLIYIQTLPDGSPLS